MIEFSMSQNGQKSTKWAKMDKNRQKWIKMGKNGQIQKCPFLINKIDCKHLYTDVSRQSC